MGFQELSYKGLTRADFCVAKAQDAIDAAKQRLSALLSVNCEIIDVSSLVCMHFLTLSSMTAGDMRAVSGASYSQGWLRTSSTDKRRLGSTVRSLQEQV